MELYCGFTFLVVFFQAVSHVKKHLSSGREEKGEHSISCSACLLKCLFPSLRMLLEENTSPSPASFSSFSQLFLSLKPVKIPIFCLICPRLIFLDTSCADLLRYQTRSQREESNIHCLMTNPEI